MGDSVENYATYKLVGQEWATQSGDRVLKCTYRYDMVNKVIKIKYKYPCHLEVIDKIKKRRKDTNRTLVQTFYSDKNKFEFIDNQLRYDEAYSYEISELRK